MFKKTEDELGFEPISPAFGDTQAEKWLEQACNSNAAFIKNMQIDQERRSKTFEGVLIGEAVDVGETMNFEIKADYLGNCSLTLPAFGYQTEGRFEHIHEALSIGMTELSIKEAAFTQSPAAKRSVKQTAEYRDVANKAMAKVNSANILSKPSSGYEKMCGND